MRAETIGRRQDGSRIDGVNSGDRIVARATLLAFLRFRKGFDSLAILNYQFGWLRGLQKLLKGRNFLVARAGFEPKTALPPQSNSLGFFQLPRSDWLDLTRRPFNDLPGRG
jgi:hypothetical protein